MRPQLADTLQPFPAKIDIIDILRGIAALLVVIGHIWGLMWAWQATFSQAGWLFRISSAPDLARIIGYPLTQFGSLGVAIFFAISGFCIHYGFLRGKEGKDIVSFLLRRIFRIVPAFIVSMIGIVFVLDAVFLYRNNFDYSLFDIAAHITFVFNFFSSVAPINPVYWTLPIEFQLYLLYILVLFLLKRMRMEKILVWTLLLEGSMFLLVLLFWWKGVNVSNFMIFNTPLAFWFDWMIGAYVAQQYLNGKRSFSRWVLIATSAGLVMSLVYLPFTYFRYMFGALLGAYLIDVAVRKKYTTKIARLFSWFGHISYSLYLWHLPVMSTAVSWLIRKKFILNTPLSRLWVELGALIVIVIPLSYLTYRFVEVPGISLGKKLVDKWRAYRQKRCALSENKDDSIVLQLPG